MCGNLHGMDPRDRIAAAQAAHRDAEEAAAKALADYHQVIAEVMGEGKLKQRDIVELTSYNRERIRQITLRQRVIGMRAEGLDDTAIAAALEVPAERVPLIAEGRTSPGRKA